MLDDLSGWEREHLIEELHDAVTVWAACDQIERHL